MPGCGEHTGLFHPVLSGKCWPLSRSFKLVQQCRVHDSGYSWAIRCGGHYQLSREKAQLGKAFQMLSQFLFGGFLKSFLPNLYEWGADEISGHSFFSDSLFYIWFLELLSKFCKEKKTLEFHRHEPVWAGKLLGALLEYHKPPSFPLTERWPWGGCRGLYNLRWLIHKMEPSGWPQRTLVGINGAALQSTCHAESSQVRLVSVTPDCFLCVFHPDPTSDWRAHCFSLWMWPCVVSQKPLGTFWVAHNVKLISFSTIKSIQTQRLTHVLL